METLFVLSTKQHSSERSPPFKGLFVLLALFPPPPRAPSPASYPDTMVTRCYHDEEGEWCPGATGITAFDNRWL